MKKKIQKPFNVEAAKNGAKVETRDGDSVRILCYDRKSNNLNINFPIIALTNHNGMVLKLKKLVICHRPATGRG